MCTCERLEHTHTSRSTKTQTPVDRLCCRGGRARVQLHCEIHTVCNHTQLRPQIDCGAVPAAPECNCTADFMQRPPFQCFAGDADHARRRVAHQVRAIHSCMMTLCFPRPAALPLGWVICKLTHARTHLSKLSNAAVDSPVPRLCRFHVPPGRRQWYKQQQQQQQCRQRQRPPSGAAAARSSSPLRSLSAA